jgi:hypothetical protein
MTLITQHSTIGHFCGIEAIGMARDKLCISDLAVITHVITRPQVANTLLISVLATPPTDMSKATVNVTKRCF